MCLIPCYGFAVDNCLRFKYNVDVNITNTTDNNTTFEKSSENLVGKLGYTLSNIEYSYQVLMIPIKVTDGYCLSLRSIDVNIKPKFNIVLDKRLKDDSCAYKIVYQHEQDHKNVFEKTIKDNIDNIKKAIIEASKSVKPVFIKDMDAANNVQTESTKSIEKHKSVEKIKEKIQNTIDEENQKIDTRGDDYSIWKCEDFYNEMKDFYESITID